MLFLNAISTTKCAKICSSMKTPAPIFQEKYAEETPKVVASEKYETDSLALQTAWRHKSRVSFLRVKSPSLIILCEASYKIINFLPLMCKLNVYSVLLKTTSK
jgi:hypothetical protein